MVEERTVPSVAGLAAMMVVDVVGLFRRGIGSWRLCGPMIGKSFDGLSED